MPPFAPNLQPGQMPPFRPNFIPPPFPPNGAAPPPGFRPPVNMGYPPPIRPGLGAGPGPGSGSGLPHLPNGMPHPPRMGGPGQGYSPSPGYGGPPGRPGFVKEVKTTKVFVGSIAPGVTDKTLEELLSVSQTFLPLVRKLIVGMWTSA